MKTCSVCKEWFLWNIWGPEIYAERYFAACATRKLDLRAVKAELEAA